MIGGAMPDLSEDTPESAPTATQDLAPEDRVMYHRPCVDCEYDLIGLARRAVCPECGLPIAESVIGVRPFAPTRAYASRLRRGGVVLQSCHGLLIVGYCVPYAAPCLLLITAAGWWLVGSRPGLPGDTRGDDLRVSATRVRWWAAAQAVAMTMYLVAFFGHNRLWWADLGPPAVVVGLLLLAGVPATGAAWAGLGHMKRVARRVPDRSLDWLVIWLRPAAAAWAFGVVAFPLVLGVPSHGMFGIAPAGAVFALVTVGWCLGFAMLWGVTQFASAMHNLLPESG